jgi:DNA-binding HxlR family transcriptional regulator
MRKKQILIPLIVNIMRTKITLIFKLPNLIFSARYLLFLPMTLAGRRMTPYNRYQNESCRKGKSMEAATAFNTQCPIARALDSIGQWWNILILREAMYGLTRFDEFEKALHIAPTMLTRRLKSLVEVGVLERRMYSERPARYEYLLTDAGRDFRSVIVALYAWSNRHLAPEGPSVILVDAKSGALADPVLIDRNSGAPITAADFVFAAGPAANERIIKRLSATRPMRGPSGDAPVLFDTEEAAAAKKPRKQAAVLKSPAAAAKRVKIATAEVAATAPAGKAGRRK